VVGKEGFKARWRVLHLNRNFPQYWIGKKYKIGDSSFGVRLFSPNIYQSVTRTVKYAIMFIIFTFMAFFFSEVIARVKIHPIQYLLVGSAITLFYLLLLSLAEHLNFALAYLISSGAVIGMIAGYSKAILNSKYLVALSIGDL